jgi:hypothetical protein
MNARCICSLAFSHPGMSAVPAVMNTRSGLVGMVVLTIIG